jgi:hypothetical protein
MAITVYNEDKPLQVDDPEAFFKKFHIIKAAGGDVANGISQKVSLKTTSQLNCVPIAR